MELYSEADVVSKVVVPDLAALGYVEGSTRHGRVVVRHEYPINAQSGREKKTIFADLVVFVDDVPVIVVDAKNPREFLTDNDREQVVSYARLLDKIAPYAALCNGPWQVYDAIRKQQIKALPRIADLLSDLQGRRLTKGQQNALRSQANRTLLAIDSARDLSRLMRRCHDTIRNLKGYDPTKAFDELSKVLFAKMFEERELNQGRRDYNRFTLQSVRDMRKQGVEIIQQLWKDTVASNRYREVFSDEATDQEIELPPEAVDKIVDLLEDKSLVLTDMDVKGVAFEEFLSATYRGGGLGQYFTPRAIVNFMVDLVDPAIGERVTDPSCGSGGFLIRVYDIGSEKIRLSDFSAREKERRLAELANHSLVGIDWEERAARTCKMNMILHGDGHAGVYQANALDIEEVTLKVKERRRFYPDAPTIEEGSFDVVLTNPPFGAHDDIPRILQHYELGRGKTQKRETLLLERQIRLLRPGGRIAVVIPEGILSNKSRDRRLREYILRECVVKAVIRLPQDTFKMSGGAACTSVLYAVKKNPEDPKARAQGDIFFARAEYIGVAPSGKPIPENDLPAIRELYRRFENGEWAGIEMEPTSSGGMRFIREEPSNDERLWLEPTVNRTSLLLDRLSYVIRRPRITDRFSYTYFHPEYWRMMNVLADMSVSTVITTMQALCRPGYPSSGKRPSEQSLEGIPILKVRNVTGHGIDLDTDFAPDSDAIRKECARGLLRKDDILITSTGEGTIGRVDIYPYHEFAIADGEITILRLLPGVNPAFVLELLRSEYGQIRMLRHVSGSTGQTHLMPEYVRDMDIPVLAPDLQQSIVECMAEARAASEGLATRAETLRIDGAKTLATAQRDMTNALRESGAIIVSLDDLCIAGYPSRGRKPSEESTEGIPILKVRNVTRRGIDLDTDFAPDNEVTRIECASALVHKGDLLITSTGEGTIGRVGTYPYDEPAIADGHVSIVRLRPEVNARYIAEFLRSEHGQVQMLRFVSGSTGQTELLVEHIRGLRVPLPDPAVQESVVARMGEARMTDDELSKQAADLRSEGAATIAHAQIDMMRRLNASDETELGSVGVEGDHHATP